MDELTIEDKKYLSSRQAAKVTGYAKDYVGQLCREGRVEARLVGRNWYVLEDSILAHRFGAEEGGNQPEETASVVASTWDSPVYKPEIVAQVPEFAPKIPVESPEVPVVVSANPAVLADMQSAWQDWFKSKETTLPEPSEMLIEEHYDHTGEETTPTESVTIERIHEEASVEEPEIVEEVAEYVPISITRQQRPAPEQPRVADKTLQEVTTRQSQAPKARRRTRKGSGAILNAVLIGVTALVIVVAIIGSGATDSYLEKKSFVSPVTNFIAGITQIESNK